MRKNTSAFTLVEIIIWLTIFSIFILVATAAFWTSLSNLQYIKSIGEEQESMLYDSFIIDELIWNPEKIYEINSNTSTWYLFKIDRSKYNYSFATFDVYDENSWTYDYKKFWLKKIIPLNDIIEISWNHIFTSPWDNDIKNITTGNSFFTNTWVLNNPTWMLVNWSELFISDTWNNCIRKVSTVQNSAIWDCFIWSEKKPWVSNDLLISPTYLAKDSTYLYISDTYNNKIRRVNLSWGNIEDVLWNWKNWLWLTETGTNFWLNLPTGIVHDDGYLYVSDTGNNRILKVNTTTFSVEWFVWTWEPKTIWVKDWTSSPDKISIDHPTTLKIASWKLYFLESLSWVIKSVSLLLPNIVKNELWSYENIAYFWDFETDNDKDWAFEKIWFNSWSIVSEDNWYIPFSWYKSYKLSDNNSWSWYFKYNFDSINISSSQKMYLSFYAKSLSGSTNIDYWFTLNDSFIWTKYKTWILNEEWSKYYIESDFDITNNINWFKINFSTWSLLWKEILIDLIDLNLKNINFNDWVWNKFENNFWYLGSFYINWDNSFASELIFGRNINFKENNISGLNKYSYTFNWINNSTNNYLFDDYMWKTRLNSIIFDEKRYVNQSNSNELNSIKLEFNTYNWYYIDKYIWIK